MSYYGDFDPGNVLDFSFCTVNTSGAPTLLTGSQVLSVFKGSSTVSVTTGVTLTTNFASITGSNHVTIDTSTSAGFYASGNDFMAILTAGTVGGTSVVGYVVGEFSIQHRSPLRPTTAARTLDVSAGGEAGLDWANVGSQSTAVTLSATSTLALQPTTAGRTLDVTATGGAGIDWGNVENQTTTVALTNTTISGGTITAGFVADSVWNALLTGATYNIPTSAGRRLRTLQDVGNYFYGAVWLDTNSANTGSTFPDDGTFLNPVNTLARALTVAAAATQPLKALNVLAGSTITLASTFNGWSFLGTSYNLSLGGQDITGTLFDRGAVVTGTGTGTYPIFQQCRMSGTTLPACLINEAIFVNTFTMSGTGQYVVINGVDGDASGSEPIFDFGSAVGSSGLALRDWAGGVQVANMKTGDYLSVGGNGRLVIASSCTGGEVRIRGTFDVTNDGSGQTIVQTADYNATNVAAAIWQDATAGDFTVTSSAGAALFQIASDLPVKITKNVACANFPFFMVDSTTHTTGATGLTITAQRSLDGGALAACANTASEIGSGYYKISLAATDTNANNIGFLFTATGADPLAFTVVTQPT